MGHVGRRQQGAAPGLAGGGGSGGSGVIEATSATTRTKWVTVDATMTLHGISYRDFDELMAGRMTRCVMNVLQFDGVTLEDVTIHPVQPPGTRGRHTRRLSAATVGVEAIIMVDTVETGEQVHKDLERWTAPERAGKFAQALGQSGMPPDITATNLKVSVDGAAPDSSPSAASSSAWGVVSTGSMYNTLVGLAYVLVGAAGCLLVAMYKGWVDRYLVMEAIHESWMSTTEAVSAAFEYAKRKWRQRRGPGGGHGGYGGMAGASYDPVSPAGQHDNRQVPHSAVDTAYVPPSAAPAPLPPPAATVASNSADNSSSGSSLFGSPAPAPAPATPQFSIDDDDDDQATSAPPPPPPAAVTAPAPPPPPATSTAPLVDLFDLPNTIENHNNL